MSVSARVGDLAEQIRGVTYDKSEASTTPRTGYLPILRAGNIGAAGLTYDDLVFVPKARISDRQMVRRNDILIATSSGSLEGVGKAARSPQDFQGAFGAFCKVLRPGPNVNPAYLAHFFQTREYRRRASRLAAGANINNLRNEHLDGMLIPLPPLPEQRRIAAILDKADELRAKRRAALAKLDALTDSIFLEMFGDPATNPKGWPRNRLGDLFEIARGGSPRPIDDFITEAADGVNWVTISDASESRKYITSTSRRIRPEGANRSRAVKPGDFLLTNSMSFGRPYIMATEGCIHDGWLVLSPRAAGSDAQYFHALLSTPALLAEFRRLAPGATVKNLNSELVRNVSVPIPPAKAQAEFGAAVSAIERIANQQRNSKTQLAALFNSLQARAFQGEL